jgi:hypothetical protein
MQSRQMLGAPPRIENIFRSEILTRTETTRMHEQKYVLFIVGMHRSGTSAVAGACHLMGLDTGRTLMLPNAANAKGFWENQLIVDVHDRFLCEHGVDWDTADFLPDGWWQGEPADRAATHLEQVLLREFDPQKNWVIKDPRLCLLLPIWKNALRNLGRTALVLLVFRHPQEVISSMIRRDRISSERATRTFLHYTLNSIETTAAYPRAAVSYETALRMSGAFGDALSSAFPQLELSEDPEGIAEYLTDDMRHEKAHADGSPFDALFRDLQSSSCGLIPIPAVLQYGYGLRAVAPPPKSTDIAELERELAAIRKRAVAYKGHYLRLEHEMLVMYDARVAADKERERASQIGLPSDKHNAHHGRPITAEQCKLIVRRNGIDWFAHGRCVGCGSTTGWQFFPTGSDILVAFNRSCNCSGHYHTGDPRTWEDFAQAFNSNAPEVRAEMWARFNTAEARHPDD